MRQRMHRRDWRDAASRGNGSGSLRAGADKTAKPTGRFSHQVHGPTVRGQGEEHVITHILVIVHLSLGIKKKRERETDRQKSKKVCQIKPPTTTSTLTQSRRETYCILQVQVPRITSNGHPREERDDVIVGLREERQNVKAFFVFCESGGTRTKGKQ